MKSGKDSNLGLAKRSARFQGQVLTSTARAICLGAQDRQGERISSRELTNRIQAAITLVSEMTDTLLQDLWNPWGLTSICGPDELGNPLPSFAYKALERLGWQATSPTQVHVCSRMKRMAEEAAGRTLRTGEERAWVVECLLATYPWDTQELKDQLWKQLPRSTSSTWVRNLQRRVRKFLLQTGVLPINLCDLEPTSTHGDSLLLAATDSQYAFLTQTDDIADALILEILLPTNSRPRTRQEWAWHRLLIRGLEYALGEGAGFCLPTLRVRYGRLQIDLPIEISRPPVAAQHVRSFNLDWGVTRLFTGSVLEKLRDEDGRPIQDRHGKGIIFTDGRPFHFQVRGMSAKYHRVRAHFQQLRAKADQYARILGGNPSPESRSRFEKLHTRATGEAKGCATRMSNLNKEIAKLAAKWVVEQALANGCTLICVEDLKDLEAGGMGPVLNKKISAQVRGMVLAELNYQAAKVGLVVRSVTAGGTSANCSRCTQSLNHVRSSDDHRPGWHWARCRHCGLQADRDHASSEYTGMRGLLASGEGKEERVTTDLPVRLKRGRKNSRQKLPKISKRNIPYLRRHPPVLEEKQAGGETTLTLSTNLADLGACSQSTPSGPTARHRSTGHRSSGKSQAVANYPRCRFDGTRYALRSVATITPVKQRLDHRVTVEALLPGTHPRGAVLSNV